VSPQDTPACPPGLALSSAFELAGREGREWLTQAQAVGGEGRAIRFGEGAVFDGRLLDGQLNIVEVKYIRDAKFIPRLRSSLERIGATVSRYGWRNARVILAVVFDQESDLPKADVPLLEMKGFGVPVVVRPFSLAELRRRFGL
jgi:hypothetical protein